MRLSDEVHVEFRGKTLADVHDDVLLYALSQDEGQRYVARAVWTGVVIGAACGLLIGWLAGSVL